MTEIIWNAKDCLKELDPKSTIIFSCCERHHNDWFKYTGAKHIENVYIFNGSDIVSRKRQWNTCVKTAVAIGGGKVIDSAKRYKKEHAEKLIVIPTLFGNGSHVTNISVVDDPKGRYSIKDNDFYPSVCYLDEYFVNYIPDDLLKLQRIDAIAHAVESLENPNSTKHSRSICHSALFHLTDTKNNKNFISGATLAAQGMTLAGTGLAHLLSYPFTNEGNPHAEAVKNCLISALDYMGSKYTDMVASFYNDIEQHTEKMPLRMKVSEAIDQMLRDTYHIMNCPIPVTRDMLIDLLEEIIIK